MGREVSGKKVMLAGRMKEEETDDSVHFMRSVKQQIGC